MDIYEGAPRYSLFIETDNKKYFYDINLERFILSEDNYKASKSSLMALDFLTSNFKNKIEFANHYGIKDNIKKCYITYQFKGEKLLAPVFNNEKWAHMALSYNGKEIDFRDKENLEMYRDIYREIIDDSSNFSSILLENRKRLINLSPKTILSIKAIKTHERTIKQKEQNGFYNLKAKDIYLADRYGFYEDLKKRLKKYREFRTIYLNYCKYKKLNNEEIKKDVDNKKKVLIPPHQISFFE
ncbi:MAG: hypothetical protein IJ568_07580 [Bacilli bacterium]|nr:hypothetical protein [Bacilli bacterium]